MQSVRQIQRLNELELQKCVPPNASWHTDYRDTAYIHIGGLPFELSEGDILTIFSQYGNPVHLNLVRDKETGKSRGFAFLKYEDQRSCDLAVDNLSGAGVMGRVLGVDHCRYKLKEGEVEGEGLEDGVENAGDETDREGDERRKRRRKSDSESEEEEERRPMIKEEAELAKLLREHDEDDPMKQYLVREKKEEVAEALKRLEVSKKDSKGREREIDSKRRHHRSRTHDSDDEDDRRRDRHRSRRDREKDEDRDRKDGHRSRRNEEDRERREKHRSREEEGDRRRDDHRRSKRDYPSDEEEDRRRRDRRSRRDRSAEDGVRQNGHRRPRRSVSRDDSRRRD